MAMDLARNIHADATAIAPGPPPGTLHPDYLAVGAAAAAREIAATAREEAGVAFDRIARIIRRCILLARKLQEPLPRTPETARTPHQARTATRQAITTAITTAIHATNASNDTRHTTEALRHDLLGRLDSLEIDDELANRPTHEIIQSLLQDLALARQSHPAKTANTARTPPTPHQAPIPQAKTPNPPPPNPATTQPPTPPQRPPTRPGPA